MPFREVSKVQTRREFVTLALRPGANKSELCRRFGISRPTGDKWLERFAAEGVSGLEDRSRRPRSSPRRVSTSTEERVLQLREETGWGGRKIAARLRALGYSKVPSPSTVTDILRRHGRLQSSGRPPGPWQRFERAAPNELWQMDFKGHFAMDGGRCHPLTILDDHSRYAVCLQAMTNERGQGVQARLEATFRRYGVPDAFLVDNGSPWGARGPSRHTRLTVWLMRMGIGVMHSRPRHPQTLGKDERFHRTLKYELLERQRLATLSQCQWHFDRWRSRYNHDRPHEALQMQVPAHLYTQSRRSMPTTLPRIDYDAGEAVRKVQGKGEISFRGQVYCIGKAFRGHRVALRPTTSDGVLDVYFHRFRVASITLRSRRDQSADCVNDVSAHL